MGIYDSEPLQEELVPIQFQQLKPGFINGSFMTLKTQNVFTIDSWLPFGN